MDVDKSGRMMAVNDHLAQEMARMRIEGMLAEAARARVVASLPRPERRPAGLLGRVGGWWAGRGKKGLGYEVEEVCCA